MDKEIIKIKRNELIDTIYVLNSIIANYKGKVGLYVRALQITKMLENILNKSTTNKQ